MHQLYEKKKNFDLSQESCRNYKRKLTRKKI